MKIKGFIDISLSDWDGRVSSVIFLPNCNMRCPFCYNKSLVLHPEKMPTIAQKQIEDYLETNRKWIDGVVITGGEPTLQTDLPIFCEKMKKMDLRVKVDTNGTNPTMIKRLTEQQLIDYIALDVKAPLTDEKYSVACGVNATPFLDNIRETIQILLKDALDYEFRTTLVPTLHQTEDLEKICKTIKGCRKYALQNFKSDTETINPKYQNLKPFFRTQMENFLQTAKKTISNTTIRGQASS